MFSDKPDRNYAGQKLEVAQGRFDSIANDLKQHNARNRGIFFVINHGGHVDVDIKRINASLSRWTLFPLRNSLRV